MRVDIDAVMSRIQKLITLSEHDNTPVHEKEQAIAKMAEIMLKFNIDESQLRTTSPEARRHAEVKMSSYTVPNKANRGKARTNALAFIAKAMGCRIAIYNSSNSRTPYRLVVVGLTSNLKMLDRLFPSILSQMDRAADIAGRAYVKSEMHNNFYLTREQITQNGQKFRSSFILGFGERVSRMIEDSRNSMISASTSTELVFVGDQARVDQHFEEMYPKLRKARKTNVHSLGYQTGYEAGANANISVECDSVTA